MVAEMLVCYQDVVPFCLMQCIWVKGNAWTFDRVELLVSKLMLIYLASLQFVGDIKPFSVFFFP
jgi:hypothetical protein